MINKAQEPSSPILPNSADKYKRMALKLRRRYHPRQDEQVKELPPAHRSPKKLEAIMESKEASREAVNPEHSVESLNKQPGFLKKMVPLAQLPLRKTDRDERPKYNFQVSSERFHVFFIKYKDGEPFRVLAQLTENVDSLKKSIEILKNLKRSQQQLLTADGLELVGQKLLKDYKLESGVTLTLKMVQKVQLSVIALAGVGEIMNCLEININQTSTLQNLKKIIEQTWGIPQGLQSLHFNGRLLSDRLATMDALGVKSGDSFELKLDLNQYRPISIRSTQKVLKNLIAMKEQLIYDLILSVEGILSWQYEYFISFEGKKLNYKDKFFDSNIPSFEVLEVERKKLNEPIQGKVRTLTGQCVQMSVGHNDMVAALKQKIFELHNYPVKLQVLKQGAVELLNHRKLSQYVPGTTFELDLRLKLRDVPQ